MDSNRIEKLIDIIMKAARGDYSVEVELSDNYDDLDAIGIGINMMIEDIKNSGGKLQKAHDQLEQKVKDRTSELEKHRHHLEELIKERTTKLEQSNRKLQDFAFIASHDLQEPLRKIIVFGNLLKSRCNKSLSEQGRDFLERMQNAAERMQSLINGLLAFSRVSTQEQPFVSVDLNQVAKDVLSDLEVPGKRVDSLVETDPLPVVDGDPLQMRQLFQNLISNGLKFCEPGVQPKVRIYSKQEDEGPNPAQAGYCRIMVQDNGIGFEEKYTDRIFEVFQRLHGRGKYKGTGMGLAICRRIVERHKGSITAKSFPGQGALFIVTLPVKQDFKKEMQNE